MTAAPSDLVIDGLDTVAEVRAERRAWSCPPPTASGAAAWTRTGPARRARTRSPSPSAPPPAPPMRAQAAHAVPRALSAVQNCPIPNGNMLRKLQCDFGWDWNIALAPSASTGASRWSRKGDRIDDILVTQTHAAGPARRDAAVHTDGAGCDRNPLRCRRKRPGPERRRAADASTIDDPALWWPAGLGAQTLHDADRHRRAPPPPPAASACAT